VVQIDPDVGALWVADLRTPGLVQGYGFLSQRPLQRIRERTDFEFRAVGEWQDCPLGRLCRLGVDAGIIPPPGETRHPLWSEGPAILALVYAGNTSLLPDAVAEWAKFDPHGPLDIGGIWRTVAGHNDRGVPFAAIADAIATLL
jgi:hypothetical protein